VAVADKVWGFGGKERGISRLEVLVSLLIIGIIAALFLDRMTYYEELAEKTAMESLEQQLQSALRIKAAELMIGKRYAELAQLDCVNPFSLLEGMLGNYARKDTESREAFRPGAWRYDRAACELIYQPSSRRYLAVTGSAAKNDEALRFRSRLVRSGPDGGIVAIVLEAETPYQWFE
jgi:type II secretory pathway pseudopilin PulG